MGSGVGLILVPVAAFVTRWGAIRASHPAYGILLSVVAALGSLLLWRGVGRTARRRRRSRVATRVVLVALVVVLGGTTWSVRPLAATEAAVAAMADGPRVTVDGTSTRITLNPTREVRSVELVFYPGGLVDPRAYANILRPIAEAGYPVTIIKPPFGFAFLAAGSAVDRPAGRAIVVGGHSLGGVVAAGDVGEDAGIEGLLLWAAFPADGVADRIDLEAMSIYGSEDALTTPGDVAASMPDLPPSTRFVEIEGAVHSHFGDYGDQRGDGTPTISRDESRAQIVAASLELLDAVSHRVTP
jgi:hypothetical protein